MVDAQRPRWSDAFKGNLIFFGSMSENVASSILGMMHRISGTAWGILACGSLLLSLYYVWFVFRRWRRWPSIHMSPREKQIITPLALGSILLSYLYIVLVFRSIGHHG